MTLRLVLVCALLAACEPVFIGDDADASPPGILRTLWTDLDRHYALFGAKNVDWNAIAAEFFPQVNQRTTQDELWTVATGMLGRLRDPHVQMNTPDKSRFFNGGPKLDPAAERFSVWTIKNVYLHNSYQVLGDQRLLYGVLADDVAYLWIGTFAGAASWVADVDRVVADASRRKGLVVDLRANGGGTSRNLYDALSVFLETDVTYMRWRERSGPAHDDFAPYSDVTVIRDPARPSYRGRLAVLVDNFTGSSSDHFHYVAKEFIPQATTFGERTSGTFGSIESYKVLANGWWYTYSAREATSLDGVALDSFDGMEPDVPVLGSQDELRQGHDLVLDAAVAQLLAP